MDRLFLEEPSAKRKQEAIDYLKETVKYQSDFNGTGCMERCLDDLSYEEWLDELEHRKDIEYLNIIGRCESKTFFVVRENDDEIVGVLTYGKSRNDNYSSCGEINAIYVLSDYQKKNGEKCIFSTFNCNDFIRRWNE